MLKFLFLVHRYLGIGLGLVMLLWCLSGFVMMYKPYPELDEQEQLALLPGLNLSACCTTPVFDPDLEQPFKSFHIQMLNNVPVLFLQTAAEQLVTVTLMEGRIFHYVNQKNIERQAQQFSERAGLGAFRMEGSIDNDQWTVYGAYNPHRPLYKFAAEDEEETQWYISSRTGEIVQVTTGDQRFWGYLGAVVHWLYPTLLRERVQLWSQVVIWLTIIGILLTLTGLYFGIRQYKTRGRGRNKSPYRGLSVWHHYSGLLFGVLTLSWVFSGLFSMNPWGALEGDGMRNEQALLRSDDLTLTEIAPTLARLALLRLDNNIVRVEGEKLLGQLYLFRVDRSGQRTRLLPSTLAEAVPGTALLDTLASLLSPAAPPLAVDVITEEDSYYYKHHDSVTLPAWRVISGDPGHTRYYLDPQTGRLLSKIDAEKRWYRWLFYGLHRGDFTATLRSRPIWDLLMWTLLLGVTATCVTGFCMGVRRLVRNSRRNRKSFADPAAVYHLGSQQH